MLFQVDLSSNHIGVEGGKAIAGAISVSNSLTSCNILKNNIGVAAARLLVDAVKDKDISLCGIQPSQTSAHFQGQHLKPPDAVLLASDLSKAVVSGSLMEVLAFLPHIFCVHTKSGPAT